MNDSGKLRAEVQVAHARLMHWLLEEAYPLWFTRGVDAVGGGFHEGLSLSGTPLDEPRRARVQSRQIFAFSKAASLGWAGDARAAVLHGVEYFISRYKRPDGLFRTVVRQDGMPLDDRALLYDQAFALFSFASARSVTGDSLDLAAEAESLWRALVTSLKRHGPGFKSGELTTLPLQSNPHMHLFESAIAWAQTDIGGVWRERANDLGALALDSLIDGLTGMVHELFADDWTPLPGLEGRIVEPGHQFEWAWLLLTWGGGRSPEVGEAALRLIDLAERHGVRRGIAVNALLDDGSVHDEEARLWPQTERLRAAALATRLYDDARYWKMTCNAAEGLLRYLSTPVRGLWYDLLRPSGEFVNMPANAGTFYHIIGAVSELDVLVRSSNSRRGV